MMVNYPGMTTVVKLKTNTKFKASKSSLEKYLRWKDIYIIAENKNRKISYDNKQHSTQNKNPIDLYKNNKYLGTFKTYKEIVIFLKEKYNIDVKERYLNKYKKIKNFKLIRALQ